MSIPFVDYGGNQLALLPPYVAENVSLFAFFIQADEIALQRLLDRRLNAPFGPEQRFIPSGSVVLVVFNKIGKMYSQNSPYRERGWFSEQEAAIWMRVVDTKLEKSFWFHPYMFVDNSYAMALGREVYGFPKAFGFLQIPDTPQTAESFSLKTLALPVYDVNTQGVYVDLLQARKTERSEWPDLGAALDFAAKLIGLEARAGNLAGQLELLLSSISDLEHLEVPMVFLKQLPEGNEPGFACYQSVIEATATASKMRNVSVVPGKWQIDIANMASHPIVDDLGLSGNVVDSLFQLWLSFDMTVGLGEAIETQRGIAARPKKIAILGGGVGGLTTALELTKEAGWQSRFDITLYQVGWRLGGKGASGRGECNRIEEHGLHIWLGFYENAFRVIREVYKENEANRKPGSPLRDWTDAFKKHSFVALMDRDAQARGEKWLVWPVHAPEFPGTPGDGEPLTLWDSFVRLWGWLEEVYMDSTFHRRGGNSTEHSRFWSHLLHSFQRLIPELREFCGFDLLEQIFSIKDIALKMASDPAWNNPDSHKRLANLTWHFREAFRARMKTHESAGEVEFQRLYQIVELVTTVTKGLLECGYLFDHGKLDGLTQEFQDWLREQGAEPVACDIKQSCVLRGLYDLVFAYHNGEASRPSFEAGVALRCVLLIMGSYKGAIFWKMQAGMGDVVFGPLFEVLRARGVKFKFFHRAEELVLNKSGDAVESVRLSVQATLKQPACGYQPFVMAQDLPCWPAQPCFDQLVEGEAIQQGGFDLESFWTNWANPGSITLQAGKDYDQVVLAISIGALPYLFSDTTKLPARFQQMLQKVETVATQAVQLWVKKPLADLGWNGGSVVLDAYSDPINTWAVMEQVLCRENWLEDAVKSIHYFCGQMEGGIPPRHDSFAPSTALQRVHEEGGRFIDKYLPMLLPNFAEEDVVSRYVRANINPSERYVTSVAGSTEYRLRVNESGLSNVTLAGDWTRNGFNAGCVEAAVMSGIQAANSIAGRPLNLGIDGPLAK